VELVLLHFFKPSTCSTKQKLFLCEALQQSDIGSITARGQGLTADAHPSADQAGFLGDNQQMEAMEAC